MIGPSETCIGIGDWFKEISQSFPFCRVACQSGSLHYILTAEYITRRKIVIDTISLTHYRSFGPAILEVRVDPVKIDHRIGQLPISSERLQAIYFLAVFDHHIGLTIIVNENR